MFKNLFNLIFLLNLLSLVSYRVKCLKTKLFMRDFFLDSCFQVQTNLKPFFGDCYLNNEKFYAQLISQIDRIQAIKEDLTINKFLKEKLFIGFDDYFREMYKDNKGYLQKLDSIS